MGKFLKIEPEQVGSSFDIIELGYIEGEMQHGHVHRVSVTLDNGRRFIHERSFREHFVMVDHGEGFEYVMCDESAPLAAQRVVDRVIAAGRINLARWHEGRPAYGSDAYVDEGWTEIDWMEERNAEGAPIF